jgi:2-polyprenyl-6-methoxyphenol hydroxylase-like FAD-dependent oxidoreductase
MQQPRRPGGHFAGIQFDYDNIDTSKWPYRLPGPADTNMAVEMEHLESALAARASAMGVEIRRGLGVEDFDQSDDEVTVRAGGETFRGRWLVGCDGGRSTVRKAAASSSSAPIRSSPAIPLQVEMADPDKLPWAATTRRRACIPVAARDDRDGRVRRRRFPPNPADHARARAGGVAPRLRHRRHRDGAQLATTWTDRAYQATRTARGGCCSPATPRTSIRPWAARGSTSGLATR